MLAILKDLSLCSPGKPHCTNPYFKLVSKTSSLRLLWLPPMDNIYNTISMHILTPQILPHLRQEDLQARLIPTQDPRESSCTQRSNTLAHILVRDGAEKFVLLAFRPRVDGDVKPCFGDVDKTDIFHVLAPILAVLEVASNSRHRFDHEVVPSMIVSTCCLNWKRKWVNG